MANKRIDQPTGTQTVDVSSGIGNGNIGSFTMIGSGGTIPAEDIQRAHVATLAFEFCRTMTTAELAAKQLAA